ncbi:MAG: hypothetical protein GY868_14015 [Deltaproteobacteria bacterium]|nr:hypothetical protein [Deltaproteobacteria bacterium]
MAPSVICFLNYSLLSFFQEAVSRKVPNKQTYVLFIYIANSGSYEPLFPAKQNHVRQNCLAGQDCLALQDSQDKTPGAGKLFLSIGKT